VEGKFSAQFLEIITLYAVAIG